MGGRVVENQEHLFARISPGYQLQEVQELDRSVPLVELVGHGPGSDVEGGEQIGGAVPDVVVRVPRNLSGLHRQQWLGPVESLDHGLLVDAENQCLIGRVQIEAHDIGDLGLQLRVVAVLESALAVGLEAMLPPNPLNRAPAHAEMVGQCPGAPVRTPLWRTFQRRRDHPGEVLLAVGEGMTATLPLLQTGQPSFAETRTPKPNCGLRTARTAGDLMVGNALGSEKDDLGSLHVTLGNGAAPGPSLEVDALLVRDLERGCRPIGHLTIVRSFCRICKLIVSQDTSDRYCPLEV